MLSGGCIITIEQGLWSNSLATRCEEMTHWKRSWCWERLRAREEGDRGWAGWMASPTWWAWIWASSGRWWRTGKPGMLQSMGSQRVGHDWTTTRVFGVAIWLDRGRRNGEIVLKQCLHSRGIMCTFWVTWEEAYGNYRGVLSPKPAWKWPCLWYGKSKWYYFIEIGNWTKLLITKVSAGYSIRNHQSLPNHLKTLIWSLLYGITSPGDGVTITTSAIITMLFFPS